MKEVRSSEGYPYTDFSSSVLCRCFEMSGNLPHDNLLTISIWDRDYMKDDLIGTTVIDLENRFYSNHWAHCGLAAEYLK